VAEYEIILKKQAEEQAEERQRVDQAEAELKRFVDRPEVYLPSVDSPLSSPSEIMAKLRQNPLFLMGRHECQIFAVRYAKRQYKPAVAFRLKWQNQLGSFRTTIPNAEDWLSSRRLVLDTERRMWVDLETLRFIVKRQGRR
jgi:hypothetical protein